MSIGQLVSKLRLQLRRRLTKSASMLKVVAALWACVLLWTVVSFLMSMPRHRTQVRTVRDTPPPPVVRRVMPIHPPPPPSIQEMSQGSSFLAPTSGAHVDALGAACFTDKCPGSTIDFSAINTTILIGILSDPIADVTFRAAARATWIKSAIALGKVRSKFFFTSSSEEVEREAREHGDVIVGSQRHVAMPAAFQMLEHFAGAKDALHILRVDVRSYVSVPRLLAKLAQVCAAPECRGEDLWAGRQISNKEITHDRPYQEDTGLSAYLPYMSSGAYVMSMSLAVALSLMHNDIGLKNYGAEDVSMGVWLIPMAARRIDLGTSIQLERPCCFDSRGNMVVDICAEQAEQVPIVLSVLNKPEYLYQYHDAISKCSE